VGTNDSTVRKATAIFAEHEAFIRTSISIHAGGKLDPEDLYQEFYLSLIRKPIPDDVRDLKGYLYRVIGHHVVDAIRSGRSYSRTVKKYAEETRISINTEEPRNAFIDEEHQNATVAGMVHHLQDREAEAFVLKYRDDCNIMEIAAKMGVNRRTVSRYLSESLRKLHRRLAAE
jgi:RNA polymerase sigma factor (sigma-70 family)